MALETPGVVAGKSPGGGRRPSLAGGDGGYDGFGSDGAVMAVVWVMEVEALAAWTETRTRGHDGHSEGRDVGGNYDGGENCCGFRNYSRQQLSSYRCCKSTRPQCLKTLATED